MTTQTSLVTPDALTAPYWEAARRRELSLQRCTQCRTFLHFPGVLCSSCGSASLAWEKVSGRGTVYSFVVVHQTAIAQFKSRVPYAVAWIELEEGPSARVLSDLTDCDLASLGIGDAVEVWFDDSNPDFIIPRFRLRR